MPRLLQPPGPPRRFQLPEPGSREPRLPREAATLRSRLILSWLGLCSLLLLISTREAPGKWVSWIVEQGSERRPVWSPGAPRPGRSASAPEPQLAVATPRRGVLSPDGLGVPKLPAQVLSSLSDAPSSASSPPPAGQPGASESAHERPPSARLATPGAGQLGPLDRGEGGRPTSAPEPEGAPNSPRRERPPEPDGALDAQPTGPGLASAAARDGLPAAVEATSTPTASPGKSTTAGHLPGPADAETDRQPTGAVAAAMPGIRPSTELAREPSAAAEPGEAPAARAPAASTHSPVGIWLPPPGPPSLAERVAASSREAVATGSRAPAADERGRRPPLGVAAAAGSPSRRAPAGSDGKPRPDSGRRTTAAPAGPRMPERGKPAGLPRNPTAEAMSCEKAAALQRQFVSPAAPSVRDVPREAYAAVLDGGEYFRYCRVPPTTAISVCVAVQRGRAIGTTVRTSPVSQSSASCIRKSLQSLTFPYGTALDIVRTEFAPVR